MISKRCKISILIITLLMVLSVYAQDNQQFSGDLFGTGGQVSLSGKDAMDIQNGSIHTSNNVSFVSDDMTLKCEDFLYLPNENKIIAKGKKNKPVEIIQTDFRATCGKFEYRVKEKLTILEDNPVIVQKDASGNQTKISGTTIKVDQSDPNAGVKLSVIGSKNVRSSIQYAPPKQKGEKPSTTAVSPVRKTTPIEENTKSVEKKPEIEDGL